MMSDQHYYMADQLGAGSVRSGLAGRRDASIADAGQSFYQRYGKRALDLGLTLMSLPASVPLIGAVALLVMLDGGKPFFGHLRVGQGGRMFRCWKLRTMVPDAEKVLEDYLAKDPAIRAYWDENFKLEHDPRITRIGAFMRKTSLDELPQLWNVLIGEMSMVGSRPVTKAELEKYGDFLPVYLEQRPGITGMWQVHGRNDVSYPVRVSLDQRYMCKISLLTDLKLIFGTIGVMLRKTGR
jgi:exopolysaccharide production protein ExoY